MQLNLEVAYPGFNASYLVWVNEVSLPVFTCCGYNFNVGISAFTADQKLVSFKLWGDVSWFVAATTAVTRTVAVWEAKLESMLLSPNAALGGATQHLECSACFEYGFDAYFWDAQVGVHWVYVGVWVANAAEFTATAGIADCF